MSQGDLCKTCRNRRGTGELSFTGQLTGPALDPSIVRKRQERIRAEHVRRRVEQDRLERASTAPLEGHPRFFEWCAAISDVDLGVYHFCAWQETQSCPKYVCGVLDADRPRSNGVGTGREGDLSSDQADVPTHFLKVNLPDGDFGRPIPNAATVGNARTKVATLGMKTVEMQAVRVGSDLSALELDYEFIDLDQQRPVPAISGNGVNGSYLIFGGPGAGKTTAYKFILAQLLAHEDRPGCLLLDPKGALALWLAKTLKECDREKDLELVTLDKHNTFNVFGSGIPARELGRLLSDVVMAEAGAVDEGWQILVTELLESSMVLLASMTTHPITPRQLLGSVLYPQRFPGQNQPMLYVEYLAERLADTEDLDVRDAGSRIRGYAEHSLKERNFVRSLIERSLGELRREQWAWMSQNTDNNDIYENVIRRHKIVFVGVGYGLPAFQRSLLTLMKAIYQQSVLTQLATRDKSAAFSILACDEFGQIVTEGTTGMVSDSRFFSQAREAGCLSLLALQSVATARSRFPVAMRDRWEGILGNVSGRLFMRLNDSETARLASELIGSREIRLRISTEGRSVQGTSVSDSYSTVERPKVPDWIFTSRLPTFYGLVQGNFDGATQVASFVRFPEPPKDGG